MERIKNIIIIILLIIIIVNHFSPSEEGKLDKLDRLESKIDSLNLRKDSVRRAVDSTHIKIITNEKHYKERINTIINQSSYSDSLYISDYIGRYIESHKSYFQ